MEQNIIAIVNFKQACAYIKNGVKPVDIEYNNEGRLIFFFVDKDTKILWEKWKRHELEI